MELGEGERDLMKMLMQTDQPEETIQRPMEDPAMVQSGGYSQPGMGYGSAHYSGMQQQQLPGMGHHQQPRGSSYHSISPGQMIPRSPNNGMMPQDLDLVLQQQQYQQQQQQHQQAAYGGGNFQGYNGGYGGPRTMSPQTSVQSMGAYQGGFPSEQGYPQGTGSNHTVGEFGPQTGSNQAMGIPGPASLSLANLSARQQQYYSDGYGMNMPVSPVHKQMQQGGGFLQHTGMPYSQQVQSYPSNSYPKRPSPSSVPNQMQGFNAGGSFNARSNTGMQMPNMPYQSPTSPYQPPHSPVRRSTTSPVQQQDAGLYSRPREAFPQPRSPFGSSQAQFQLQQQQQQQPHSSCMFVQPSTTPSQSQYQSQQQKVGGLTQRRASYPGQQSTMKMPSPPLKRSPPTSLPNPKSPDLLRGNQLGFDDRGSVKPVSKKEKSSSPPYFDPSQVVSASQMKGTLSKKGGDNQKGLPRLRRSASDVGSPSVSPPLTKKVDASRSEEEGCDMKVDESKKLEEAKTVRGTRQSEHETHSPKKQLGDKREGNFETVKENKLSGPGSSLSPERNESVVETLKPKNVAQSSKESKHQQVVGCKEGEDGKSGAEKPLGNPDTKETEVTAAVGSLDLIKKDGISKEVINKAGKNPGGDIAAGCNMENVTCEKDDLTRDKERKATNDNVHVCCAEKDGEKKQESGKVDGDREGSSSETTNVEDKLSKKPVVEAGKPANKKDNHLEEISAENKKTGQPVNGLDEELVHRDRKVGQSDITTVEDNQDTAQRNGDASEASEKKESDETDTVSTDAKGTVKQGFEPVKSANVVTPASNKCEPSTIKSNIKDKTAEENQHSVKPNSGSTPTVVVKEKPVTVSLRCEERLSSDDDDRLSASKADSSPPPVESKTQGIQTIEQTTASPRSSHQQVTPIKATIIAKGKSAQSNQQVMVAKTTSGQMYLIQGNLLVPVQSLSSDSLSKQNSKVLIVNPVKTPTGQVKHIQTASVLKIADAIENIGHEASKGTAQKDTAYEAGNEKNDEKLKSNRLRSSKGDTKSVEESPADKKHHTAALEKEKVGSSSASNAGTDLTNSAGKKEETPSTSRQAESMPEDKPPTKTPGRGRPPGSKDKQKRKSFVHKSKRTENEEKVDEPASKRKFSKTASVVKDMSSTEASTSSKRPLSLEVPTVNASKSPKRRKVSTSGSPVKHISVMPRGGVDGDSWVCCLCGKRSGHNLLGDLYGPYKTKYSKEKTDSSFAKDSKLSQKLSSPGRKSSSSSDAHVERKSSSNEDDMENYDLDLWIHRDCGVWSPGVFMLGKILHGLEQAVESAAQHKCVKCSEVGATLVCFKRGCIKMYHFACARDSGCTFVEDNFTIFCSTHK